MSPFLEPVCNIIKILHIFTLLYIKEVTNKGPPYSKGNSTPYFVITHKKRESEEHMCVCVCVRARMHALICWVISNSCSLNDCRPPGSSLHEIVQVRLLEWVAIPSPGNLPNPGIEHVFPALAREFFTMVPPGSLCACVYIYKHTHTWITLLYTWN